MNCVLFLSGKRKPCGQESITISASSEEGRISARTFEETKAQAGNGWKLVISSAYALSIPSLRLSHSPSCGHRMLKKGVCRLYGIAPDDLYRMWMSGKGEQFR